MIQCKKYYGFKYTHWIFFKLQKILPPYWRLFLAPAKDCSLRLQRWGPSGPPKLFENLFGKFWGNPFGKFYRNPFNFFAEIHFEKFAEIHLENFEEIHLIIFEANHLENFEGSFWRVILEGNFGGSFWRIILWGHLGKWSWGSIVSEIKIKSGFRGALHAKSLT